MERWTRIRHMGRVDGLSQRQIAKKLGINRRTVKRGLESPDPPGYGPRRKRPSKLNPYLGEIERMLGGDHSLSGVRIFEEIEALGYGRRMSILLMGPRTVSAELENESGVEVSANGIWRALARHGLSTRAKRLVSAITQSSPHPITQIPQAT